MKFVPVVQTVQMVQDVSAGGILKPFEVFNDLNGAKRLIDLNVLNEL
jgi:hypothetical protein